MIMPLGVIARYLHNIWEPCTINGTINFIVDVLPGQVYNLIRAIFFSYHVLSGAEGRIYEGENARRSIDYGRGNERV